MKPSLFAVVYLLLSVPFAAADNWSQFRGPLANGTTPESGFPTEWSADSNVDWSVPLPQPGNGSPIVCGGRVFVCSAEDSQGLKRSLICFAADSGERRWTQTVAVDQEMPTHKTNPYGGSTPACDGKRVFVWHATGGLHAYSLDGEHLWSRTDLGEFRHMWGYGSSPVVIGDRVVLNSGPGKQVFVAAFDVQTGDTLWKHDEPVEGDGEHNADNKYMGTWSTPVPMQTEGRDIAVVALHKRIVAFDVDSGEIHWFFPVDSDRGDLAYSSPIINGKRCVFNAGFSGPAMAFEIDGQGDITDKQIWNVKSNPQSIGTGIVVDGYWYRPGAGPNLIECLDLKTGQAIWKERSKGAFWGSIALAGEVAYVTDQRGSTIVFRPSPDRFIKLAENQLGDGCNATPALADGAIYVRTDEKLWCIR